MKILGVDPGSRITGYGLIEVKSSHLELIECGVLRAKGPRFEQRVSEIHLDFRSLIKELQPSTVCVERIFLGKNIDSAFKLGHIRGVIISEALQASCELFEYAAREVKKGITGYGQADKGRVSEFVQKQLSITGKIPEDASDALALAVHHGQRRTANLQPRL